jgi:hypothetical protein
MSAAASAGAAPAPTRSPDFEYGDLELASAAPGDEITPPSGSIAHAQRDCECRASPMNKSHRVAEDSSMGPARGSAGHFRSAEKPDAFV